MKFPAAKAAVDKEWEKLEKIPARDLTKVRSKSEVIDEARTKGATVHFASLMDSVIWRMPNWRQNTKNTKVDLYSEGILWKMILDLTQYLQHKDHRCHIQTSKVRRTSSGRSISSYPGENRRCSKILENSQIGIFRFGLVYHDTNGLNHGPVWKIQSFFWSEICTVILWQDCYGKGNLRKSYWSTVGRRFPIGNAYSHTVKKGYSYLCTWMILNWLEWNKTLIRCGKCSTKKSIWENRHLSLIMYTWSVLKDNVK